MTKRPEFSVPATFTNTFLFAAIAFGLWTSVCLVASWPMPTMSQFSGLWGGAIGIVLAMLGVVTVAKWLDVEAKDEAADEAKSVAEVAIACRRAPRRKVVDVRTEFSVDEAAAAADRVKADSLSAWRR